MTQDHVRTQFLRFLQDKTEARSRPERVCAYLLRQTTYKVCSLRCGERALSGGMAFALPEGIAVHWDYAQPGCFVKLC